MAEIPEGSFRMGSSAFYPEEGPVREVYVDAFLIDRAPVTVAEFERFVAETGHVTLAERPPAAGDYPDADPDLLVEGSAVFHPTSGAVPLNDPSLWWAYVPGASWRHPWGPKSDNTGRADHPVSHVAFEDACAYASWADKELPTEAQWERAARGGLEDATFAWGGEEQPNSPAHGEFLAGRVPMAQHGRQGLAGDLSRRIVPGKWIWAVRHDGQRVGVDHRLLLRARSRCAGDDIESLLRTAEPTCRLTEREL